MFEKTIQGIAFIYILIGISGIAGAIEHSTGLASPLSLLVSGTAAMYLEYKTVKEKEYEEKTTDNNLSGSSPIV